MEINSPGQVSSLTPELTRPNAPAHAPADGDRTAAPAGGATETARTQTVTTVAPGSDPDHDGDHDSQKEVTSGVDITV